MAEIELQGTILQNQETDIIITVVCIKYLRENSVSVRNRCLCCFVFHLYWYISASKFGSIVSGTAKGLGIADRYPRVSSAGSTSSSSGRKDERRMSKDEQSFPSSHSAHKVRHDVFCCNFLGVKVFTEYLTWQMQKCMIVID